MRLTLEALVRWEQLRGKPFGRMDYRDAGDVEALLYTTALCAGRVHTTFDLFRKVLPRRKEGDAMRAALMEAQRVLAQFQRERKEQPAGKEEPADCLIGELAAWLVAQGMEARYVMKEMELCDLSLYVEAFRRRRHEELEERRMWVYLQMLPHIDRKSLPDGERSLMLFPWERETMEAEQRNREKEDMRRFEAFMKQGRRHPPDSS